MKTRILERWRRAAHAQMGVACGLMIAASMSGCGGSSPDPERGVSPAEVNSPAAGAPSARTDGPPAPGTVTRLDASSDLDTTPVSAADYALYAAIMGGASAMLSTLTPEDRAALELEARVAAGREQASASNRGTLQRARDLHAKDLELARMQGVEPRYRKVKEKIEAVIGPGATVPAPGDRLAQENLRYLEAHRQNIERLLAILRNPLSRPAAQP